jgi:4-hydroxyphenylpyruvate dioxygenase-like putative hemolysin
MLKTYIKQTPSLYKLASKYKLINIDHIAHRCLRMNDMIKLIHKYKKLDYILQTTQYSFHELNVKAIWLHKTNAIIPRIFISSYQGDNIPNIPNNINEYYQIQSDNQYLAWTLLHGTRLNHIALSSNHIEHLYESIKKDNDFNLATTLQTSQDGDLLQFSLESDKIQYTFANKSTQSIPGCFVELIERRNNREGFEANNATKIFESTGQTKK